MDSNEVEEAWREVVGIEAELLGARSELAATERDRDWLAHASAEIEALAPEEGEETRLAEDRAAMQAGVKAGELLTGLDELLGGSEGVLSQLRQAARRIEREATDHPLLGEALASLDRALIEVSEAEEQITRAADALAFDPERLEQVEARLFDIRGLARKHRVEPDALAALGQQMRAQLAAIDAGGERIEELDRQLAAAREAYSATADRLSEARRGGGRPARQRRRLGDGAAETGRSALSHQRRSRRSRPPGARTASSSRCQQTPARPSAPSPGSPRAENYPD